MSTAPTAPAQGQRVPVYVLLLPNILLTDLAASADALRYANRFQGAVEFVLHFVGGSERIETSIGLPLLHVQPLPERLPREAMVLVPGVEGPWTPEAPAVQQAAAWLRRLPPEQPLLCVCAGSLLAAMAGRLRHRRCTTHHAHLDDLRRIEPSAVLEVNRLYVQDGAVWCSAGVTAGLDLTLHVIERLCGARCAAQVAQHMVVFQRKASMDPAPSPLLQHRNHLHRAVHRAQSAVLNDPAHTWDNTALAQAACVSPRHLTRLFAQEAGILPHDYVRKIRATLARQFAAEAPQSQEVLAQRVGFASAQQLRRAWRDFPQG